MRLTIPFAGPTQEDRAISVSSQKSVNMYAMAKKPGEKGRVVLYSDPGVLRLSSTAGTGPCRSNGLRWNENTYFVSGGKLYKQDINQTITEIGSLLTSSSRCVLAGGVSYLMLTDGTYGYSYDGTTFAQITDADFPTSPTHCAYLDGFFFVNFGGTGTFYKSASENPTSWTALGFATAAAAPDDVLALEATRKDLYIIGSETTQPYYNSGNADFPYEPYPGAIEVGIDAPYSLAFSSYGLFWLATNREGGKMIVNVSGMQFQVISDDELNWQMSKMTTTTDAYAWVRRQAGLTFYEITFPSEGKSYSYCVEAGPQIGWHERKSYVDDTLTRHRASGYWYLNNKHYVGDYTNGRLYELAFGTYTDDSNRFLRLRRTQIAHKDDLGIIVHGLYLDMEAGVGLITGQGSDPNVMMRYSVDDGHTFSSELWRSPGAIGEFSTRPTWNGLGWGRSWMFEFSVSDPINVIMKNLNADVEVLPT